MKRLTCGFLSFVIIHMVAGLSFAQSPNDRLFSRIYGAEAGAVIGNAMGEPVEGWNWERIEKHYGVLDRLIPSNNFTQDKVLPQRFGEPWVYHGHQRQAGWTEDAGRDTSCWFRRLSKRTVGSRSRTSPTSGSRRSIRRSSATTWARRT